MNRRRKDKSQKNRIKNQRNETQPINNRVFFGFFLLHLHSYAFTDSFYRSDYNVVQEKDVEGE